MRAILYIITALFLFGCNPEKYCANHGFGRIEGNDTIIKDSIVTHETMVPIYVAADSGYLTAYLECVNDKVKLMGIVEYNAGNNAKPPTIEIKNNVLTAKCKVDSFSVYRTWKSKDVYRMVKSSQTYVKITNQLTGWQWFQLWAGRVGCVILLLWLGIKYGVPLIKKTITKI